MVVMAVITTFAGIYALAKVEENRKLRRKIRRMKRRVRLGLENS